MATIAHPTGHDIDLSGRRPEAIESAPSVFVCPDCGGSLWEAAEAGLTRFRCHTGHGYTAETLLAAQNGKLENALWNAVRVLMERASLHRHLAERTADRGMELSAERYQDQALQEEQHARAIRDILASPPPDSEPRVEIDQSA